jgi:(2Fe-2S) ferredoxin
MDRFLQLLGPLVAPGGPLAGQVELGWQSCFGRCTQGPNVLVQELAPERPGERQFLLATMPRGRAGRSALYNGVGEADVADIVEHHIQRDQPVSRLIQPPARSPAGYNARSEAPPGINKPPGGPGREGDS